MAARPERKTTVFKKCWDFHRKYPPFDGSHLLYSICLPLFCAKAVQLYRALSRRNFFPSKGNIYILTLLFPYITRNKLVVRVYGTTHEILPLDFFDSCSPDLIENLQSVHCVPNEHAAQPYTYHVKIKRRTGK